MHFIFNKVCVLVTAAFALTLAPGFKLPQHSLLSRRDQGVALLVFLVLGLVEEVTVSYAGWINERIVAVCAAGLVAGPGVGLVVRAAGPWLELSVRDDGQGVPRTKSDQVFFAERPRVHALVLLRRRLRGLIGRSFQLEVRSEIGEGTTVTMRIPVPKRFGVGLVSPRPIRPELHELALN